METYFKTIRSGLIKNCDLDVIHKLIHNVIAVRKSYTTGRSYTHHLKCGDVNMVPRPLFCYPKAEIFIKNIESIFQKPFGNNFKLNLYTIIVGITYKNGNNASKLGFFPWSKVIK